MATQTEDYEAESVHHYTRPLPFFHPTRAHGLDHSSSQPTTHWSSRASRKNRYDSKPVKIHHPTPATQNQDTEKATQTQGVHHVSLKAKYTYSNLKVHLVWDVSFWVAVIFVLGSVAWCVNGCILFLPFVNAGSDDYPLASAWGFVGGTLFEVGAYLMVVEALNTHHEALFGPAVEKLIDHTHGQPEPSSKEVFHWWGKGSWRDLGYLASFVQLLAASIFWIATLTGLPGVISGMPEDPPTAITDVFYWTPQVVGGTGFVTSSTLLMLEVQSKWWKLNLKSLGWHIAFWNLIGSWGFLLCGAFGYASLEHSWVNYQSVLCTFWGSWAFLIGSLIQLWETLWREDGV